MELESFRSRDVDEIVSILNHDRVWGAYALGDLNDLNFPLARYYTNGPNLTLVFEGLQPPALLCFGGIGAIRFLLELLPAGDFTASFMPEPESIFPEKTEIISLKRMLRYKLEITDQIFSDGVAELLGQKDVEAINELMTHYPDNVFHTDQLAYPFAGIYQDDKLVACAGTHVVNPDQKVAALGNVMVHPNYHERGFGSQVVGKVLNELKDQASLIVLNCSVKNKEAQTLYEELGFTTHGRYNEAEVRLP